MCLFVSLGVFNVSSWSSPWVVSSLWGNLWKEDEKSVSSRRTRRPTILTCDLHLSGASVLLAAGGDGLRLDGLGVVVVDLRQLDLLHCVVVAELWQLAFEGAVACTGAEAFDVIDSIHFRHFVAGHRLPIEILAEFWGPAQLEIEFPSRRGFWFAAASGFDVPKREQSRLAWIESKRWSSLDLLFELRFVWNTK